MTPFKNLTAAALGALLLFQASPAFAQAALSINEKKQKTYTVTPSSGQAAIQFNTASRLSEAGLMVTYKELCITLEDANTQIVYISSFATTNANYGFPIWGTQTMCRDWTEAVPVFYFFKAGLTPLVNTLKFNVSQR